MLLNKKLKLILIFSIILIILPIAYSQQTCTATEIKDALRKALFEYFESSATSQLSVNEIKDFLRFYLSISTDKVIVDCGGSGPLSGKPYYLMLGAARNIQRGIPKCSDGTEYGQCASNGMYCYGGRLAEKCAVCGCGEDEQCSPASDKCVASQEKGTLVLGLTDKKVEGLAALNVEISQVEVHKDNRWTSFAPEKKKFELLSLADAADVIGSKKLTPGKYTQIRFQVVSADLRLEDGTAANVKIPSGEIRLVSEFTIEKDKTTYLYIDFSAESVVKAGSQYILQPVIKLKTLSEFTKDLCETLLPTCEDNNPCTSNGCSNAACTYTPVSDGTSCGTGKTCKSGACVQTCEIMNCNDNNPCTADSCSEGVCSNAPLADKTSCGTGLLCKSGTCVQEEVFCYGVSCDDKNPCTTDSCSVGVCKYQLTADGTGCGTGKTCKSGQCVLTDPCSIFKFSSVQNISLNVTTVRILLADFDGDGDLDLANGGYRAYENLPWYPNKIVYKMKVFFNDGKGMFSDSGQLFGSDWSFQYDAGDVDGDGDKDIVSGNLYNGYMGLFLNDGKGYFAVSQQKIGSYYDFLPRLADLDKDNDLDLYVGANHYTRAGKIFLNDGKGIFTQLNNTGLSVGPASSASLFDFDKDGDADLVESTYSVNAYISSTNTTISIPAYVKSYKNNGAGIFMLAQQISVSSTGAARDLGFGDVDKDGDLDYILMTSGPATGGGLYTNDGTGFFTKDLYFESQKNQSYSTQAYYNVASDGQMVDVDNDNDLDPAILGIVLANDGTGKFKACPWVHGLPVILHTAVPYGDVDKDGDLDAIGYGYTYGDTVWKLMGFDNMLIP